MHNQKQNNKFNNKPNNKPKTNNLVTPMNEEPTEMQNININISIETLINIYSLLHSLEIKGDAVDKVAFIKQTIKDIISKEQNNNDFQILMQ